MVVFVCICFMWFHCNGLSSVHSAQQLIEYLYNWHSRTSYIVHTYTLNAISHSLVVVYYSFKYSIYARRLTKTDNQINWNWKHLCMARCFSVYQMRAIVLKDVCVCWCSLSIYLFLVALPTFPIIPLSNAQT